MKRIQCIPLRFDFEPKHKCFPCETIDDEIANAIIRKKIFSDWQQWGYDEIYQWTKDHYNCSNDIAHNVAIMLSDY